MDASVFYMSIHLLYMNTHLFYLKIRLFHLTTPSLPEYSPSFITNILLNPGVRCANPGVRPANRVSSS